jgi:ATP-dependent helicase/nuclease subunit B
VLCMKRDGAGGPVHPSRLLFQCSDAQMLSRAGLLFSEPPAPEPTPPAAPGLRLDPARARARALTRLPVTGLRSYLQCPTRFYLRHVLGMRSVTDAVREPDAAAFGSLLHAVLQEGLRGEPAGIAAVEAGLAEALDRRVRALFGTRYGMAVEVLVQNAHRRLRAAARLHQELLEEGWRILRTEESCVREIGGLTVTGKIDRVDVHPEKGYRILDYKTGDAPTDPEAAHLGTRRSGAEALWTVNAKGKPKEWVDLQLPVYRWLAEGQEWYREGAPLEVGYFQLPKAVNDTAIVTWPAEREQAASARAALEHIVGSIQAGIWGPPNASVRYDEFEGLFVYGEAGFAGESDETNGQIRKP